MGTRGNGLFYSCTCGIYLYIYIYMHIYPVDESINQQFVLSSADSLGAESLHVR